MRLRTVVVSLAALTMALPGAALAVPYASGLSVAGTDVTFTLNEDAGSVAVALEGGGTMNLGAMTKGTHTVSVGTGGNHQIQVSNSTATGWTKISTDNTNTSFYLPLGVSVNRNPASPNYGAVYVTNATTGNTAFGRANPEGVYRLSADLNTVNSGTAGVTWGGSLGPMKCTVGEDDNLYVADLSNDLAYEVAPDLSGNVQLITAGNRSANQYVGSIHVTGTKAAGNRKIYLTNTNYNDTARKGVIEYNLGGADAVAAGDTGSQLIGPSYFAYYPQDAVRDSAGNWYVSQWRYAANQAPPISMFAPGTAPLNTATWEASGTYTGAYCVDVYEPNGWVAYGDYYTGFVRIFNMSDGSFVGEFDAGSRIRDLSFDGAGNIYTVDNSAEWLRVWSPGGESTMSTSFSVVPEPTTLVLLAGGVALIRRRRR